MNNQEYDDQLKTYSGKARAEDIPRIEQNIGGMNRGPIKKLWGDVQLLWMMVKDPQAAWSSKGIAIGALLYLVSPFDVIPDVVPVLGLTDDVGVILAAVGSLSYQLTKYRMQARNPQNQNATVVEAEIVPGGPSGPSARPALPPPLPSRVAAIEVEDRLRKLDELKRKQLITEQEYQAKRQQILAEI